MVRHHDAYTMLRLPTPLFNVADDASNGGGDSAAESSIQHPASSIEPSAPKPGVIATAAALLRGANGSAAQIVALRNDLAARDATIAQLQSDLAASTSTLAAHLDELTTFRNQAAELQSAVTALEAKQINVQTEVIHQLAAAGLPESALPSASSSSAAVVKTLTPDQFEALDHAERNAFFRSGGKLNID